MTEDQVHSHVMRYPTPNSIVISMCFSVRNHSMLAKEMKSSYSGFMCLILSFKLQNKARNHSLLVNFILFVLGNIMRLIKFVQIFTLV